MEVSASASVSHYGSHENSQKLQLADRFGETKAKHPEEIIEIMACFHCFHFHRMTMEVSADYPFLTKQIELKLHGPSGSARSWWIHWASAPCDPGDDPDSAA